MLLVADRQCDRGRGQLVTQVGVFNADLVAREVTFQHVLPATVQFAFSVETSAADLCAVNCIFLVGERFVVVCGVVGVQATANLYAGLLVRTLNF